MTDAIEDPLKDEIAISRLLKNWGLWRDTGQWARLRSAYASDATMKTTWFDGSAKDFVEASERLAGKGALVQHFIGPSTIEVCKLRAIAETRAILLVRDAINEVPVDVTCYGRFVDRLVKQQGRWLIQARVPIYEKDCIAPVQPGAVPHFNTDVLAAFPMGYRHLAYLQARAGATIVTDIPEHNSDAQRALYVRASQWLIAATEGANT